MAFIYRQWTQFITEDQYVHEDIKHKYGSANISIGMTFLVVWL
jgi:hypothetical protein